MSLNLILALVVATILPSCLISWILVGLVRRWAPRLGLLDRPGARKVHSHPIPLGGGLGIVGGVVATFAAGTFAVWLAQQRILPIGLVPDSIQPHLPGLLSRVGQIWLLLAGGIVLMVLGLADDRFALPWQWRLGIEFAVAAFCVYGIGLQLTAFIPWAWLTALLSVIWIVAMINSFNMLDNMDGLSGGVATIASGFLAMMLLFATEDASPRPQIFVAAMLLVLVGGLLGFLQHNWPPARIFMGDAGSYFVGFWIATSTLLATYAGSRSETPHAVLAPLCVLAIPLYDMCSVIYIRLREGRSPFEGDKRHFSHRLVELGLSKKQAVLTIYLATATCSFGALILPRTNWVGACFVMSIVVCTLSLIAILESKAWRKSE